MYSLENAIVIIERDNSQVFESIYYGNNPPSLPKLQGADFKQYRIKLPRFEIAYNFCEGYYAKLKEHKQSMYI